MTAIITVSAAKGGVGKTTLAYELAAALDGPLVDLDWDAVITAPEKPEPPKTPAKKTVGAAPPRPAVSLA